jgi:hypothetical protein
MNITTANTPAAAAEYKGLPATMTLTDGAVLTGTFLSVNSKGWNIIDANGATVSRSITRVANMDVDADAAPDMDEDTEADYMADMTAAGEIDFEDCCETGACEHDDADGNTVGLPANSEMDALVAELDGATTAEVAEIFGTSAKELRVTLRALGMGVGKGHRYHLTAEQITVVRGALEGAPIA